MKFKTLAQNFIISLSSSYDRISPVRTRLGCCIIFLLAGFTAKAGNPNIFYYVSDGDNRLYSINRTTGAVVNIGATGVSTIEAIAYYPIPGANVLYAADAGNFGTINLSTGAFTSMGQIDGGGTANGAAGAQSLNDVDGLMLDGQTFKMWAVERKAGATSDLLFQIDLTTGQFVPNAFGLGVDYLVISATGVDVDVDDLAVHPQTGVIYATSNNNGNNDVLIEINKYTGQFSLVVNLSEDDVEGLAFNNDGTLYGSEGDSDNRLSTINLTTGSMGTFRSFSGSDVEALASLVADANTVSGTVYNDLNINGALNGGETGLSGVTVNLFVDKNGDGSIDPEDIKVQTTTTDGSGNYTFYYASTGSLLISTEFSSYPASFALTTDNLEAAVFTDNVNFAETNANNNFGLATGSDCDGDGLPDFFEGTVDSDGDGVQNQCDLDSDNDGILDSVEGTEDFDDDGIPNYLDRDSDDDGIPDAIEATGGIAAAAYLSSSGNFSGTDADGNGIVDSRETSSGSGVMVAARPDSDGDGLVDYIDLDSDNDGILDITEAGGSDSDGDGQVDSPTDANSNGYADALETTALSIPNTDSAYETTNGHTIRPNYIDIDSDADGIDDTREGFSTANYGFPTLKLDFDNDGIIDFWDVSAGKTPITPNDHDSDGLADYIELDSDNDGVSDNIEGNDANLNGVADVANSGFDANGNGLDDSFDAACSGVVCSSNVAVQDEDADGEHDFRDQDGADSDGDGIDNEIDIDDDNDGILDVDEGCAADVISYPGVIDSESGVGSEANVLGAPDGLVGNWHSSGDIMIFDFGTTQAAGAKYNFTWRIRPSHSGTASLVVRESTTNSSFTTHTTGPTTTSNAFVTSTVTSQNAFRYIEIENLGGADFQVDAIGLITPGICNQDTDNDGMLDHVDLESDGDGIADIIEAGGVDADGNGTVDGSFTDTDNDGWANTFDADDGGTALTDADTDNDGFEDRIDIDADDDGILDIIESQPSGVLISPSGTDIDGDGIDDNFDPDSGNSLTNPVNTDGIDNPDYTDTDSDNDGYWDILEGWDTDNDGIADTSPAGTDTDNDGLDDNFDNVVGPNNTINVTDNGKNSSSYPDLDKPATAERDWREILDTDDDGITNVIDFDTDNDGINNYDEGCLNSVSWTTDAVIDGLAAGNLTSTNGTVGTITLSSLPVASNAGVVIANTWSTQAGSNDINGIDDVDASAAAIGLRIGAATNIITTSIAIENPILMFNFVEDGVLDFSATTVPTIVLLDEGAAITTTISGKEVTVSGGTNTADDGFSIQLIGSFTSISFTSTVTGANQSYGFSIFSGNAIDSDGDGIGNCLDLDSDNDGIPDIVEAGGEDTDGNGKVDDINANGTLTTDTDGDGLADVYDSNNGGTDIANPDTDGDGVPNTVDLDADNDGIPDVVEAGGTDENGDGRADDYVDTDFDGFNDVVDGDVGQDGTSENSSDVLTLTGSDTDNNGVPNSYPNDDNDGDGILNYLDLDADNDGIADVVEQGGTDVNGDGRADDYVDADDDGFNDVVDGDPTNALAAGSDAAGANTTDALTITGSDTDNDGAPNSYPNDDFDGDNVYNFLDLDSDDDGILDVIEQGGTDTNRDGQEDAYVDADNDGFNDNVDGDPDNSLAVGDDATDSNLAGVTTATGDDTDGDGVPNSFPNDDFDGDGLYNYLDIDADNDGIVDNTEGQGTMTYVAPVNADADGDGIDDAYDSDDANFGGVNSSFVISDIDVSVDPNSPDYLDLNSDDDFYFDFLEGHDSDGDGIADAGSPSNTGFSAGTTDIDDDGLYDGWDNNTASVDPTNTNVQGTSHPNLGNSATAERDWREISDKDNDGVADEIDIDKDNDGILDRDECLTTTANAIVGGKGGSTTNFNQDGVTSVYFDIMEIDNSFSITVNGAVLNTNNIIQLEAITAAGEVVIRFTDNTVISQPWLVNVNNLPRVRVFIDINGQVSILGTRTTSSTTLELMETANGSSFNTVNFVAGSNTFSIVNQNQIGPDAINATAYVFSSCDTDGDGIFDYCDIDSDNDGIADIIEAGGVDTDNNGIVDVFVDSDNDGFADGLDPLRGGTALSDGDQDGDGLKNRLDLDSDNDGIVDIIEAGGTDANNDGRGDISTDTDADGWFNTFDSDNGGTVLPTTNTDGDAFPNFLDLDSDNDGIIDNVEGQTTVVFLAPLGTDSDMNGWDDRYDSNNGGTAIALSNKEAAGNPDYTDDDSDGDGLPDWTEGFDDDEDGDALDDLILRATNFETSVGNPLYYVNADDTDTDGIPDWLEDDDSDNVPNFLDPDHGDYHDTDNDGLVDLYDTDNQGAVSILPDNNNNGEYDFRDASNLISLPISLIEFKAIKQNNEVVLSWSTSSELNNDYFTIERSTDGINFELILTHKGAGNSNQRIDYLQYDVSPKSGYNYYRLSQTDYNGKRKEFNVEVVYFESSSKKMEMIVYPNPSDGKVVFIEIEKPEKGACQIELLNASGQCLRRINVIISDELNNLKMDVLEGINLAAGTYYIKMISESSVNTLPIIIR